MAEAGFSSLGVGTSKGPIKSRTQEMEGPVSSPESPDLPFIISIQVAKALQIGEGDTVYLQRH